MIRLFESKDLNQILDIYQEAFAGYPWFEQLSNEEVIKRWEANSAQPNFVCLVGEQDGQITSAVWCNDTDLDTLEQERGKDLRRFVEQYFPGVTLIWGRESMTKASFQGQGWASALKETLIDQIKLRPEACLILTRMRDDNLGIIRIAEKFDYQRTGIKIPSSQKPSVYHEYWYRLVG